MGTLLLQTASAEIKTLTLPEKFADFAFDPQTGNIAAVSAETNEAYFFLGAELAQGKTDPVAKVRVGPTPCAVFFKEHLNERVFAIGCAQDSHMYLFNASPPFDAVAKAPLVQSGVSLITGSINPQDPFIYYCYGSGNEASTGAVSLRNKRDCGLAFDDTMDCAISADGDYAYRRGLWSPAGFETLLRTNPLSSEKPKFEKAFYEHDSKAEYIPDPFNRFTAVGKTLYTVTLEKKEADLNFVPAAFFRSRPVIIGFEGDGNYVSLLRRNDTDKNVVLRAASYNTLTSIGNSISVPHVLGKNSSVLPLGATPNLSEKKFRKRRRIFADDERNQVVFAENDQLHLIPLADFNLPLEPFLLAELQGERSLPIDQPAQFTLRSLNPDVTLKIDEMPKGMVADGESLTWTPTPDQVGPASIRTTLSWKDISRTIRYELNATYPRTKLPFKPSAISISPQADLAVLWTTPDNSRSSGPQQVAVVNLKTQEIQATRQIAEPINKVTFAGDFIAFTVGAERSTRCEILRISDLERVKTIVTGGLIERIEAGQGHLCIETHLGVEAYSLPTFERRGNLTKFPNATNQLTQYGIYNSGILYGYDMRPLLMVNAHTIPNFDSNSDTPTTLANANKNRFDSPRYLATDHKTRLVAFAQVPETGVYIGMYRRMESPFPGGLARNPLVTREYFVAATGFDDKRQVLLRDVVNSDFRFNSSDEKQLVATAGPNAYCAINEYLYVWPIPLEKPSSPETKPLLFLPKQSSITLSNEKTTVLRHQLIGGKSPIAYSIQVPFDGMKVDSATGDITLDNAAIQTAALEFLTKRFIGQARGESAVSTFRSSAAKIENEGAKLLGREPRGIPVAVPVIISAKDANLSHDWLTYDVIAEVPTSELLKRLTKYDQERPAPMETVTPMRPSPPPAEAKDDAAELAALKKKVADLEARVELLTRQMNLLLRSRQ